MPLVLLALRSTLFVVSFMSGCGPDLFDADVSVQGRSANVHVRAIESVRVWRQIFYSKCLILANVNDGG